MDNDFIKIMIVDDEYLIRNLLRKCIDWNSIGMEITSEASSGEEAIELVDRFKPDLIFTDICMTNIDGIEFADVVIKKYPDIKIVVITGYDDFKYAQRSIKAGIKDYLLKPINDEILLNTALKMKKVIEEDKKELSEFASIRKYFLENLHFLKERLFNGLIQPKIDNKLVQKHMEYLDFSFSHDLFQTAVIEIIFKQQYVSIKEEERISYETEVLNKIKEHFNGNDDINIFFDMNYRIVILNNSKKSVLDDELKELRLSILNSNKYYYSIGIGSFKEGIENIEMSYREALEALNYRIIYGKNSILNYESINIPKEIDENLTIKLDDKLKVYLLSESKEKLQDIIENSFDKDGSFINMSISKIKEFVFRYVSIVIEVLKELEIDAVELHSKKYNLYEEIFELDTIPDAKKYLEDISFKTIDIINNHKGKKSNKLINDIKEYMKLNLGDAELSLSKLAQVFFINSSYLSRVFKKEMGVNFNDYITKLRIDKAISLLRNTNLKAYEVGESVGIPDSSYFSTCFKRYTGVSISEYKKN